MIPGKAAQVRVLVVEDRVKMASLIRRGLRKEGLAADVAANGEDALWMAAATEYDAIVLDVMLPGIDGFEVCSRLRADGIWSPILMLTARDAVRDRVAGLDAGADDYLTKPFSYAELLARLRALARRGVPERPAELRVGSLRLDPARHRVWRGTEEIALSPKEFALLETFMRRPGEVLTADGRLFDPRHQTGKPVFYPAGINTSGAGGFVFADQAGLPGLHGDPGRLLATPIRFEHHGLITVVSASLAGRDQALDSLRK